LHHTLVQSGIDIDYPTVLLHGAGKEKKKALTEILKHLQGGVEASFVEKCFESFKEELKEAYDRLHVSLHAGTSEIFDYLSNRGVYIVLNTGYERSTAEQLIEKLGWRAGDDFDLLVTASDVPASRPAPDMIRYAMNYYSIGHPYFVVKVGDSIVDIEEGKNADCRYVIGVTTGAHTREQLSEASPTHIIDSLMELQHIIDDSAKR
jgi:phosphonatase-like hydrolase